MLFLSINTRLLVLKSKFKITCWPFSVDLYSVLTLHSSLAVLTADFHLGKKKNHFLLNQTFQNFKLVFKISKIALSFWSNEKIVIYRFCLAFRSRNLFIRIVFFVYSGAPSMQQASSSATAEVSFCHFFCLILYRVWRLVFDVTCSVHISTLLFNFIMSLTARFLCRLLSSLKRI